MKNMLNYTYLLISAVLLLASCKQDKKNEKGAARVLPYNYIEASRQVATIYNDYPARLEGMQNIDIRPMVDGYIQAVYVDEGDVVNKGKLMFKINNPQYAQTLRSAEAALRSAQTNIDNARMQVTKVKPLVEKDIISAYELEAAELNLRSAQAAYAQAQAAVSNARINVGYTNVYAPVSGVVGTLPYRVGSYVNSSTPQPLTTVSSIGNVYAYFSINEKEQLQFFKNTQGATAGQKLTNLPAVTLILSDGSEYGQKGKVQSMSGLADPQTGSFNMRATFPNPTGLLRSGVSATVRIPNRVYDAILIPQAATFDIQGRKFVYLIKPDSTVSSAPVEVTDLKDGKTYIADKGLQPGDRIVVEGVSILKDSTKISPTKTTLEIITRPEMLENTN